MFSGEQLSSYIIPFSKFIAVQLCTYACVIICTTRYDSPREDFMPWKALEGSVMPLSLDIIHVCIDVYMYVCSKYVYILQE